MADWMDPLLWAEVAGVALLLALLIWGEGVLGALRNRPKFLISIRKNQWNEIGFPWTLRLELRRRPVSLMRVHLHSRSTLYKRSFGSTLLGHAVLPDGKWKQLVTGLDSKGRARWTSREVSRLEYLYPGDVLDLPIPNEAIADVMIIDRGTKAPTVFFRL